MCLIYYICSKRITMLLKPKEKLRQIRKQKYSQAVFAELVAMDQAQYSRREKGRIAITDEEWLRFAKVLDVALEEIKEADAPLINITHNHGENENSINGYEIKISLPKNIFDIFDTKLDKLIEILSNKKE